MEDVLDVSTRPYDPRRPQVCLDETSRQVLADTRDALPPAPGRPARHDPEYARLDWALGIQERVDVHSPDAERIVRVMDQLNTHSPAALSEAFPPAEAKHLADKLEIHHTPKHGRWLNMAESELSILQRQCLDRRLGDRDSVEREVAAWVREHNDGIHTIDWRFTTDDARIKLKRLYPAFQP